MQTPDLVHAALHDLNDGVCFVLELLLGCRAPKLQLQKTIRDPDLL